MLFICIDSFSSLGATVVDTNLDIQKYYSYIWLCRKRVKICIKIYSQVINHRVTLIRTNIINAKVFLSVCYKLFTLWYRNGSNLRKGYRVVIISEIILCESEKRGGSLYGESITAKLIKMTF